MSDPKQISLIGKLGGKKLIAAVGGVAAVLMVNTMGMSEEQASHVINTIMTLITVFIGAQGIADVATKGATSSSTATVDPAEMARIALSVQMEKAREASHVAEARKAEAQKIAMQVMGANVVPAATPMEPSEVELAAQQK